MAVNKFVKEGPVDWPVTNQNDTCHGYKALKKLFMNVLCSIKRNKGINWHPELEDKVDSIIDHVRWFLSTGSFREASI